MGSRSGPGSLTRTGPDLIGISIICADHNLLHLKLMVSEAEKALKYNANLRPRLQSALLIFNLHHLGLYKLHSIAAVDRTFENSEGIHLMNVGRRAELGQLIRRSH